MSPIAYLQDLITPEWLTCTLMTLGVVQLLGLPITVFFMWGAKKDDKDGGIK